MTQALYAHMNNKRKMKKKIEASLLGVPRAAAGHRELYSLWARQVPTYSTPLQFVPPGAASTKA
jgi:hypothetical protein